ncbi:MAG: sulfatase-like hydrolase/transferase [Candidatus Nitrosotenuis sp.]
MKPNVLILTIDSLRADKIYGCHKSAITPNIDKLINDGTYFTQAISTSDTTGLSLGSLFTAKYPFRTGITHFSYNSNILTYPQILKDNGYYTFATVPDISIILKLTSNFTDRDAYVYDKRESWLQLVGGIGQSIIDRLEKLQTPWLYYIHLMDLHAPFYLPKEFDSDKYGKTRYDRMISAIDSWIGKFLEKIDLSKTLVIISADHGDHIPVVDNWNDPPKTSTLLKKGKEKLPALEPLGLKLFVAFHAIKRKYKIQKLKQGLTERQTLALLGRGQSHLFDELIRIPLILTGYGVPSSTIISTQVKQVDIFPTILDISEISTKDIVSDGKSLVQFFTNKSSTETPTYIESGARNIKNSKTINPTIYGKIIGIRTSRYKYWRSRNDPTKDVFLFDLQNDPNEEKNIASEYPDVVNMMEQILEDIKKGSVEIKQNQFSEEEIKSIEEELKKLGYM